MVDFRNRERFVIVRRALPADAVRIRNVHISSIRGLCARDYTRAQIEAWSSKKRPENYRCSMREGEVMFVALLGKRTAGFAGFKGTEIRAVYVHPRFARQGIGRALFAAVERLAKKRCVRRLRLSSSVTAVPFYRAMGFMAVRKSMFTLRDGTRIACVDMQKPLFPGAKLNLPSHNSMRQVCYVPSRAN